MVPAPTHPPRIVFFGTAPFACASLRALAQGPQAQLLALVTQPDRQVGRDLRTRPGPAKQLALDLGLPVLQPPRCREPAFIQQLRALHPDLIVVAAYGQILPPPLLELPPHGCLNVHGSLLPRHRGAAPIQWAILDGDTVTGVTLMKMDAGLDTGDILALERTPIGPTETASSLHDRLADAGAQLLLASIPEFLAGRLTPRPQPTHGITYARKIVKEDGRLDWRQPAPDLTRRIRALNPWPGSFTYLGTPPNARLLKIWTAFPEPALAGAPGTLLHADRTGLRVACGTGTLIITEVQLQGARRMPVGDFLAGHPLPPGLVMADGN